jgi:hypothetical protein
MVRLLLALALSGVALADEPPPAINPGQEYHGVAPGAQNLPPRPPKLPLKHGPQRLTWTGFQNKDGVPTVFLELTATPDYRVAEEKDALVVTLRNTVVPIRNNRRPLRVEDFGTAVKTVETESKGSTTRVVIHSDGPLGHNESVEPAAGGFHLLVIKLSKK